MPASLILLHIPKTGGRTLRLIAESLYDPESRIRLYRPEALDAFARLPPEQRAAIRFVVGHIKFGIHTQLAAPVSYVTMLREPTARVVSLYRYILRTPDHAMHEALVSRRMSLEEFAARGEAWEVENVQTRMIGARSPETSPDEALASAQHNLEHYFAVAGITERFDESLVLMMRRCGWPNRFYTPVNVAPGWTAAFAPSREAAEIIEARNRLDRALYDFARQRLVAALQQAGPSFRARARLFGLANRAYNYARLPYGRLRARALRQQRQPG